MLPLFGRLQNAPIHLPRILLLVHGLSFSFSTVPTQMCILTRVVRVSSPAHIPIMVHHHQSARLAPHRAITCPSVTSRTELRSRSHRSLLPRRGGPCPGRAAACLSRRSHTRTQPCPIHPLYRLLHGRKPVRPTTTTWTRAGEAGDAPDEDLQGAMGRHGHVLRSRTRPE